MTKTNGKDVIYVDVDDDITAIIEKVQDSAGKIVALVLPKRATVMQSVVNMKLLKRTAGDSKKNIVLITSEASLLPLAGNVGLHVAPSLQSRPEIPNAPSITDAPVSVDESENAEFDAPVDRSAAVGELSRAPITVDDDAIEIDNDEEEPAPDDALGDGKSKKQKNKPDKKLKIPNFNTFRTRLIIGIVGVLVLIVGWVFAAIVLPKATVVIKTNNVTVNTNIALTASASAKTTDAAQLIVPAEQKQFKKTDSQKVTATGQKDEGTKAKGTATLSLTDCSQDQVTVPSGTSLTANNMTFITQADVILKSVKIGNSCQNNAFKDFSTGTVNVLSQSPGDQYNLSARSYTVSGFSNVSAAGSAMTGGVSKIVTVVSQGDVDGAKQKILDANTATAKQDISNQLKTDGFYALADTFAAGTPLVTASPNVGDPASEVTVNVTVTYTMMGAKEDGIKQLLETAINKQIDTQKQKILDNGLSKAVVNVSENKSEQVKFTLQTSALAGVQQDVNDIKKAIAGKKRGEVQDLILARPGVKDVTVTYSPAWVYSTPKSVKKITITFQQSNGATNSK